MSRMLLSSIAVGSFISAVALAQERPKLSGTWIMDMSRSETPAQAAAASPSRPVTLVITESPDHLTIEQQVDGRGELVNYSYREPDTTNEPVGTTGSDKTVHGGYAKWNNGRLETLTVIRINGQAVTKTATFAIDASGRQMTVQTEIVVQHGYESAGGQDPGNRNAVKDVYIRRE